MNNSPDSITAINDFPIKEIDGRTVFMRDVAHVHDGYQVQTNSVTVDGKPGALMTIRKTGGRLDPRGDRRRPGSLAGHRQALARGRYGEADFRSVDLRSRPRSTAS